MLTLFHAPQSRSSRIVWLLEELGAEYDLRIVGIRYGDGSGPGRDPANPHPDGKVPALEHDGRLVTESAAVAIYLSDLFPEAGMAPAPDDPDRGAFLTWLVWAECEFGPALFSAAFGAPTQPGALAAVFARLTGALERGPYLMGERFGTADVMVGSALAFMRHVLPESELVDAYAARLRERPALGRAYAKDGTKPA